MTSTEAFVIVRDECFRRPVSTQISGPNHLPDLADMKFFPYDAEEASTTKKALVTEFNGLL
jgi:hypothetical protein